MFGISTINIELTSRCNKDCHMCGRRKLEAADPDFGSSLGDMPLKMVRHIASQLDECMVVQLHWNGEPTLYRNLTKASKILDYAGMYVCMDTNGLLLDQVDLTYFSSVTVSVIEGDSLENYDRQFDALSNVKTSAKINIRALGNIPPQFKKFLPFDIIHRILHAPEMSRDYQKEVTMPEIGVCLDLLHHPAIDRYGDVYPCVRINPNKTNLLGNVMDKPLGEILTCDHRLGMIDMHFKGQRKYVPLCNECDYYGCPTGQ